MATVRLMKLQAHMDAQGLKDKQVAADLAVARSFISQIRRGQREPSLELAVRIQRWSGDAVTPAELLIGN
jgi:transcriptional regulator with XRE-family HTH domain